MSPYLHESQTEKRNEASILQHTQISKAVGTLVFSAVLGVTVMCKKNQKTIVYSHGLVYFSVQLDYTELLTKEIIILYFIYFILFLLYFVFIYLGIFVTFILFLGSKLYIINLTVSSSQIFHLLFYGFELRHRYLKF